MKLAFILFQVSPKISNFRINVQTIAIHQFLGSGITAGRGALKGLVGVCGVFAGVFTGGGAVAGILSVSYSRFSRTTGQRTTKKLLLVILLKVFNFSIQNSIFLHFPITPLVLFLRLMNNHSSLCFLA
jgi:hypothetical protein